MPSQNVDTPVGPDFASLNRLRTEISPPFGAQVSNGSHRAKHKTDMGTEVYTPRSFLVTH